MSPAWAALGLFGFWDLPPAPAPVAVTGEVTEAPVLRWKAPLVGAPVNTATRSEPAGPTVAGDHVLVGYSAAPGLLVYDRRDGSYLGSYPAKAPVASAPVVVGEQVWFSDTAGYTFCYRLDQLGGTPRWSHFSGAPVLSTPTLVDGTLYLANVDETVYALDAASGTVRWRHQHTLDIERSTSLELLGAPAPAVAGDQVYVGFSDGFVVALGRADGDVRWTAEVGQGTYPDLIAPPVPVGDAVIAGGFSEPLIAFAETDRVHRWRVETGVAAPVATLDGQLYVPGTDGQLRKVDPRTGEVRWTWASGTDGTLTTPVATPAGLFLTSGEGSLYLVDPETGTTRWRFAPGTVVNGAAAPVAVAGRDVYLVTNAGLLYALRSPEPAAARRPPPPWVAGDRR